MRNNKIRFSLKLKLILYMSLMIVAISGAFTWFFLDLMRNELKHDLEKRGLSEAFNLGHDSKYGVLTEDSEILNKLIKDRINNPDVFYLIIMNSYGKVLASNYEDLVGKTLVDEITKKSLISKSSSSQLCNNVMLPVTGATSKAFYDMSAPVLSTKIKQTEFLDEDSNIFYQDLDNDPFFEGTNDDSISASEILGVVRVGLSLDRMQMKMHETLLIAIVVTTSIIFISIGISFVVAKITIAPLIRLSKVATQIAEGDLSKKVTTKSKDEIGVMTNNFNQMATKLKESILGLESKVKERTIDLEKAGIKTDAIIQNMTDGLVAIDPNLKIFITNRKFEEIMCKSDLVGQDITSIPKEFEKIAKDTLNDTNNHFSEVTIGGHLILKTSSCLITHNETVLGVLIIMRDVTVEKEIDRMKTNFISTVSHELRTPLTSILGFAVNALKFYQKDVYPMLPEDSKKHRKVAKTIDQNLNIIVAESERLTRLINDVLDIAKMEAGKIKWNIKNVNVIDICRETISAVSGYPKSSKVKIFFDSPDAVKSVSADPDRLVQVISNLMSNALKFTEEGRITLKVEPGDEYLEISVIDTGRGIEKEDLDKIFDKFKQVSDDNLTDKPKGTGLGLPICKEIIDHLGGTIWAESKIGVGSKFSFTLDYKKTHITEEKFPFPVLSYRVIDDVAQKVFPRKCKTSPQVLIVDDDTNIRKLLRQELEMCKYKVLEAKNGMEAITITKKKYDCIDLIILDIMMPVLDGYDVLGTIKTNEKFAHIPILVISAYEVERKIHRLGAEGYISKPIDKRQFSSTVSKLLRKSAEQKILVIDSDENIINVLKNALLEKGCIVSAASNCKDGLKKVKSEKPDVIMLGLEPQDIKSGLETMKALRLDKETCHIYIVLLVDSMNKDLLKIAESFKVDIIDPNVYNENLKSS